MCPASANQLPACMTCPFRNECLADISDSIKNFIHTVGANRAVAVGALITTILEVLSDDDPLKDGLLELALLHGGVEVEFCINHEEGAARIVSGSEVIH